MQSSAPGLLDDLRKQLKRVNQTARARSAGVQHLTPTLERARSRVRASIEQLSNSDDVDTLTETFEALIKAKCSGAQGLTPTKVHLESKIRQSLMHDDDSADDNSAAARDAEDWWDDDQIFPDDSDVSLPPRDLDASSAATAAAAPAAASVATRARRTRRRPNFGRVKKHRVTFGGRDPLRLRNKLVTFSVVTSYSQMRGVTDASFTAKKRRTILGARGPRAF